MNNKINEWICNDKLIVEESNYVVVPEGIYMAEYVGTQRRVSETGEYYMHKWKVANKQGEINEITELSSVKLTDSTKLGGIVKALGFDLEKNKEFTLNDLVGKKCQLIIKIVIKNGDKRNNITEHLKL